MPTSRLKLMTNVPLTGFAKYANYYKGKKGWTDPEDGKVKDLPDNIQLKGSWDGTQDESLFLPIALVGVMLEMGLLRQENHDDKYGCPAYTVLNQARKIRVLKTEDGKKRPISISWADGAAAPAASPPTARAATPSQPTQPQQPAKETRGAAPPEPTDAAKLDKLRRAHRRRLQAIAETTANAWRAGAVELDKFLLERSIEKTKLPSQIYFEMLHSMGSTNAIQAHREQLIVEHRPKKEPAAAPAVRPQAAALQGASALQPISEETTRLEPVKPRGPDDEEDLNDFPGFPNMPGEDDDLPF